MKLDEAVDGIAQERRYGVLAVPGFVDCEVFETEVGGEVEHGKVARTERTHRLGARRMGERAERDIGASCNRIRLERLHVAIHHAAQARKYIGDGLAGRGVPDNGGELERGMAERETHELGTGVSGSANDDRSNRCAHVLISVLMLTCGSTKALSKKAAALMAPRLSNR